MLDARNIYRKVTRKIYDFSPEQLENLLAVVWLSHEESDRFIELVGSRLGRMLDEGARCFEPDVPESTEGEGAAAPRYAEALRTLRAEMDAFVSSLPADAAHAETLADFDAGLATFQTDLEHFEKALSKERAAWAKGAPSKAKPLVKTVERLGPLAETSRDLVKQADLLTKLAGRVLETCESELGARDSDSWSSRDLSRLRKAADAARHDAVEQLKQVRYFHRQTAWLTDRFPDAKLLDVEGLVKLVDRAELEANDWSLSPGRYVGVAPEVEDEDFDFEETLRDIHVELVGLNGEAVELAETIAKNFEELGV